MRIINLKQNWNNKLALNQFSIIEMKDIEKNVKGDIIVVKYNDVEIQAEIVYIKHFSWNGLTAAMTRINFDQPRRGGETILRRMYCSRSQNINKQQFSFIILKKTKR